MSRVGKKPINIPKGVEIMIDAGTVTVRGPQGELKKSVSPLVEVKIEDSLVSVKRSSDDRRARSIHGLTRALIQNMVDGVNKGYSKGIELVGVGYRAALENKVLTLSIGYTQPVKYTLPDLIQAEVTARDTQVILKSIDKELLGRVAAQIRSLKPPEPYKGKGIRYVDEHVRQKAGKSAATT